MKKKQVKLKSCEIKKIFINLYKGTLHNLSSKFQRRVNRPLTIPQRVDALLKAEGWYTEC